MNNCITSQTGSSSDLQSIDCCHCVICGSRFEAFLPFGNPPKPNVRCPICKLAVRHRITWIYLQRNTNLFDGHYKKMLHIAPEKQITKNILCYPYIDYLSSDIDVHKAMVQMDLTNIKYPDNSFDVIYCSHVLEHIPNDRAAMSELRRVLKKDGWAIILVPITREKTIEDPTVVTPEEREKLYGQRDHVRRYGKDFLNRLEDAGFQVTVEHIGINEYSQKEIEHLGIHVNTPIFLCRK